MSIKSLGKSVISSLLESQVRQLRRKNKFTIVAVAGSVGKTSTKLAIAKTLEGNFRVRYQEGNYNDRLTVPLALFNHDEPNILNPFAWVKILLKNQAVLQRPYAFDVAVLELGIDGLGQMKHFAYLQPELIVVTAVSPEHMVYLKTLDNVAQEELLSLSFSKQALINRDDIPEKYLPERPHFSYGLKDADYRLSKRLPEGLKGQDLQIEFPDKTVLGTKTKLLGEQGAKSILGAAAVGNILGMSKEALSKNLAQIEAFPGRMQILLGVNDSTLIDDTYNASQLTVLAALDVLYAAAAPQRIAILGSMNEMGVESPLLHEQVGSYCDPKKLDLVITVGKDAQDYLAPAAKAKGCQVKSFLNPREAGEYAKTVLKSGAVVLAKGSEGGIFTEEALKVLLADPTDKAKLVRQSPKWLQKKKSYFS